MNGRGRERSAHARLGAANAGGGVHDFPTPAGCPARVAIDHVALGHRAHALAVIGQEPNCAGAVCALYAARQRLVGEAEVEITDLCLRAEQSSLYTPRGLREYARNTSNTERVAQLIAPPATSHVHERHG